jgi:predicted AlkP superfamily pyrophosphatase or phosphodiesterase
MTYCVGDLSTSPVGTKSKAGQMSPRNLVGGTVADEMRLRFGSKVVGISIKDRGAILPSGRKPAGAFWFDAGTGDFVTSSYYMAELPAWVRSFNGQKRAASVIGQKWERLLDASAYAGRDDAPGEGAAPGQKAAVFPHTIAPSQSGTFSNILPTPFSNEILAALAQAAVEGERLGEGPGPDLLTVSFSAVDAAGHRFGPYSHEAQDIVLRLDRQLAQLFAYLEKKIGMEKVMVMLTSDHGVAPTPESAAAEGFAAERVDEALLVGDLQAQLSERFGNARLLLAKGFFDGQLFLDHEALREAQVSAGDVVAFVRDWALGTGKFQAVYSREQLLEGRVHGPVGERVMRGFHAQRSGDGVLVYKPYFVEYGTGKTGTNHGSPYAYDTHVPVLFHGAAFKPGRYAEPFAISDVAATLCAALRITPPAGSMGQPCVRLLAEQTP